MMGSPRYGKHKNHKIIDIIVRISFWKIVNETPRWEIYGYKSRDRGKKKKKTCQIRCLQMARHCAANVHGRATFVPRCVFYLAVYSCCVELSKLRCGNREFTAGKQTSVRLKLTVGQSIRLRFGGRRC